ncbi:MAG: hypothetical protein PHF67_05100 [Candidatus Nanoarchaeia archaeon]|nr:hypothetical protein [Candidatus Nanoarchaeia archaeon]
MTTLYDEYDPARPLEMPMERMYRASVGPFSGRVVQFAGITPGTTKEDIFYLWLSDLITGKLDCHQTPREGLRDFCRVMPEELNTAEQRSLETRARFYAEMCVAFAELVLDPNAGKGPEHFCCGYEF